MPHILLVFVVSIPSGITVIVGLRWSIRRAEQCLFGSFDYNSGAAQAAPHKFIFESD